MEVIKRDVNSYGVWNLIYRYLLPGWWIMPVSTRRSRHGLAR
jgi:hypothetical protein